MSHDQTKTTEMSGLKFTVIVPVFNEEAVLPEFHRRLAVVMDSLAMQGEIIYVNDACPPQLHRLESRFSWFPDRSV